MGTMSAGFLVCRTTRSRAGVSDRRCHVGSPEIDRDSRAEQHISAGSESKRSPENGRPSLHQMEGAAADGTASAGMRGRTRRVCRLGARMHGTIDPVVTCAYAHVLQGVAPELERIGTPPGGPMRGGPTCHLPHFEGKAWRHRGHETLNAKRCRRAECPIVADSSPSRGARFLHHVRVRVGDWRTELRVPSVGGGRLRGPFPQARHCVDSVFIT